MQLRPTFALLKTNLVLFVLTLLSFQTIAQEKPSYQMDFIRAGYKIKNDKPQITTVLRVTPTIDNFKLILGTKIGLDMGDGLRTFDFRKEKDPLVQAIVYDPNFEEKDKELYQFIKSAPAFSKEGEFFYIVFNLTGPSVKKTDEMKLTYGLWETNNTDVRHEKEFTFKVEEFKQ